MNELNILNSQKIIFVGPNETRVIVKELKWRDAIGFLSQLSAQAGRFITSDGKLVLSVDKLPDIIKETSGLCDFLLEKSAGLSVEQIETLSASEALEILDASLELNITPDLFARGKALAGRIGNLIGAKPTGEPLTKSSPNNAIS